MTAQTGRLQKTCRCTQQFLFHQLGCSMHLFALTGLCTHQATQSCVQRKFTQHISHTTPLTHTSSTLKHHILCNAMLKAEGTPAAQQGPLLTAVCIKRQQLSMQRNGVAHEMILGFKNMKQLDFRHTRLYTQIHTHAHTHTYTHTCPLYQLSCCRCPITSTGPIS